MVIKVKNTIVTCIVFMIIYNCGESPNKSTHLKNSINIKPIVIGNSWKFSKYLISETHPDTMKEIIYSIEEFKIEGKKYNAGIAHKSFYSINYINDISEIQWNGQDGLYTLGSLSQDDTILFSPKLKYKHPVKIGEEWEYPLLNHLYYLETNEFSDTLNIKCVETDYIISTQLDTFKTIVYYYSLRPYPDIHCKNHYFLYFCPEIGKIREEYYSSPKSDYNFKQRDEADLKIRYNLIEYHLNEE